MTLAAICSKSAAEFLLWVEFLLARPAPALAFSRASDARLPARSIRLQRRRGINYELGNLVIVIFTIKQLPVGLLLRDEALTSPVGWDH